MPAKKADTATAVVNIKPLKIGIISFTVEGRSELIVNKMSEKAKQEIRDKQAHKPKEPRQPRDPVADFEAAKYILPNGKEGMCANSFKLGAVRAGKSVGIPMVDGYTMFHVMGELVEIRGESRMREDKVCHHGVTNLAYRPGYPKWECNLTVEYNADLINPDILLDLFNRAGFAGVGQWRSEKKGGFGRFRIKADDQTEPA